MVSPVRGDYRRCQAEIPLIVLFKFAEPALLSYTSRLEFEWQLIVAWLFEQTASSENRVRLLSSLIVWAFGTVVLTLLAIYLTFQITPWPSALLMRRGMDAGGDNLVLLLEKHSPPNVRAHLNEQYDASDPDAFLDVFYPSKFDDTKERLPTIVWVHGGAWIAGDKHHIGTYLRVLAARGYTVVGVNYSLAPGKTYPTPLRQINTAVAYLTHNAERLHIDPSSFVLAGDSAGAQIAGQLGALISSPSYAKEVGIDPSVDRSRLRAMVLYCGIFDTENMRSVRSFRTILWSNIRTMLWSYLGTKDYLNDPRLAQLSVTRHISPEFPPIFISVGNADPAAHHSYKLTQAAARQGVTVDTLFFPDMHTPPLFHEYQFNLDAEAGKLALERSIEFLKKQLPH
jgi:acetyl esterase